MMGSADWHIMGSLLAGPLPGILVGSYFAVRVAERALKLVLATIVRVGWPHRLRPRQYGRLELYGAVSMRVSDRGSSDPVDRKTAIPTKQESIMPPIPQRR